MHARLSTITSAGRRYSTKTDERGFFHLEDIEPGTYDVHVLLPTGLKPLPDSRVIVTQHRCSGLELVTVAENPTS